MSRLWASIGALWVATFLVVINVAWLTRNRSRQARRIVDLAKQFTAQKQDYAILVWALTGDLLVLLLLFAWYLRAAT